MKRIRFRIPVLVLFLFSLLFLTVDRVSAHRDHSDTGDAASPSVLRDDDIQDAPRTLPDRDEDILIRMFVPELVRVPNDITASLEVNNSSERGSKVYLKDVRLFLDGELIHREKPGILYGDGGWERRFIRLLEEMSPGISGLYHHRIFIPLEDVQGHSEKSDSEMYARALHSVEEARTDTYFRDNRTTVLIDFGVRLSELQKHGRFMPGRHITLTAVLTVEEGGRSREVEHRTTITIAEPFPRAALSYEDDPGVLRQIPGTWYSGDLHVHSCKDEASFFGERGCPDCQAESINFGDDNTLLDLKEQYQALGAGWFTITSHSYCIEQSSEYEQVWSECQALSDESFLVIPDTELQSTEEGPQIGEDMGNLICPDGVNHTGAHFITSHKPGGMDGFLEVCDDPLYSFLDNISWIRSENGFGIVNHPSDFTWGWNSIDLLSDRENDGYHGIEIWNGPTGGGQGGYVAFWVDRLLEGKKFYAYSGSDTHDDVYDFGWNHALVFGPLSRASLRTSLKNGRLYVSNHQLLGILAYARGAGVSIMGGDLTVAPDVNSVRLYIISGMGTRTGTVTVFMGRAGFAEEEIIATYDNLTGTELLQLAVPVVNGPFYLRAYSEVPGESLYAYSNPIWVEHAGVGD